MGTCSAIAYGYPGCERPIWEHANFGGEFANDADVFFAFASWLDEKCAQYLPRYLVTETPWLPTNKGIAGARRVIGLDAIAKLVARRRGIRMREYAIKTVALFFLGTGKLKSAEKKQRTKEICEERYGWRPVSLDEADTLALFCYAESVLSPATQRCIGPLFDQAGGDSPR